LTHAQTADRTLPAVTVEAPREVRAKPAARTPTVRSSSARRSTRPLVATPATVSAQTGNATASAARENLYQAPAGQTQTTIDRSQFENMPSFSVSDVLRDSPGIFVKQGSGPRDFGISIRGSNARNGFGIRNLVIFDDGFPVTQPDGLSRSDLIDPRATARSMSSGGRRRLSRRNQMRASRAARVKAALTLPNFNRANSTE
jgi:iron complex outermembrane receptor protein